MAFKLGLYKFDVPIIRRKEKVGREPIPFFPHAHVDFVLCKEIEFVGRRVMIGTVKFNFKKIFYHSYFWLPAACAAQP